MSASVRSPHRFITYVTFVITLFFVLAVSASAHAADKQVIKALYIPLADHYASIVAYERYREQMKYADYQRETTKLRATLGCSTEYSGW